MKCSNLLLIIVLFTSSCSTTEPASTVCKDTNCANYTSQTEAQTAFNLDPICRADLDRNNNKIACEEPGNSVKTCASTSNCGCSGKTKSDCDYDVCCKWTVGSGCGCK